MIAAMVEREQQFQTGGYRKFTARDDAGHQIAELILRNAPRVVSTGAARFGDEVEPGLDAVHGLDDGVCRTVRVQIRRNSALDGIDFDGAIKINFRIRDVGQRSENAACFGAVAVAVDRPGRDGVSIFGLDCESERVIDFDRRGVFRGAMPRTEKTGLCDVQIPIDQPLQVLQGIFAPNGSGLHGQPPIPGWTAVAFGMPSTLQSARRRKRNSP